MPEKFINDIVQPWCELNRFLAERIALPPKISRVTRDAIALAVAIKHQAEAVSAGRVAALAGVESDRRRRVVDTESVPNRLMSDVADAAKHSTSLRNVERKNELRVEAAFEFDAMNRFRFLRNQIVVNHASHGEFDFMAESASAIHYWIKKLDVQIRWDSKLAVGRNDFCQTAFLYFHPDHQVTMREIGLRFLGRNPTGDLVLSYPPEIMFAVYDYPPWKARRRTA